MLNAEAVFASGLQSVTVAAGVEGEAALAEELESLSCPIPELWRHLGTSHT